MQMGDCRYADFCRMGDYWVAHYYWASGQKSKAAQIALVDGVYLYAAYGPDGNVIDTGAMQKLYPAKLAIERAVRSIRRKADSPQVRHKGAKRRKS